MNVGPMAHVKNTQIFIDAASASSSSLVKAYCGLVAIELTLKSVVDLGDHDVPSGLTRLNIKHPTPGGYNLLGLIVRLRNEIDSINVTGKIGERRTAPHTSYPFIRYTTFDSDGWAPPNTTEKEINALATTVARIRSYLKKHYGFQV